MEAAREAAAQAKAQREAEAKAAEEAAAAKAAKVEAEKAAKVAEAQAAKEAKALAKKSGGGFDLVGALAPVVGVGVSCTGASPMSPSDSLMPPAGPPARNKLAPRAAAASGCGALTHQLPAPWTRPTPHPSA